MEWITEAVSLGWFPSWGRDNTNQGPRCQCASRIPVSCILYHTFFPMTRQKSLLLEKARSNLGKLYLLISMTNQFSA